MSAGTIEGSLAGQAILAPEPEAGARPFRRTTTRRAVTLELVAPLLGLCLLLGLWVAAGLLLEANPAYGAFTGFAQGPALASFVELVRSGDAWRGAGPSLARIGQGLAYAFLLGAPLGLLIGASPLAERILQPPFQLLRMVSPLSWMPIAVLTFPSWEGAIVFLIAAAAIWPIVFATAAGVKRVDPVWLTLARNLGAGPSPPCARSSFPPCYRTSSRACASPSASPGSCWSRSSISGSRAGSATPSTTRATRSPTTVSPPSSC